MTANPTAGSAATPAVRDRLAIALDLPDLDDALAPRP